LHQSRQSLRRGAVLLGLALLGCGRDDKLTPVHGHVYYHGKPLAGGTIAFTPDPERGGHGPLAYGEIDAEGRYSLHTGDTPGAVPGWHRVTIAPAGETPASAVVDLPRKYGDPEQSGLLREVKTDRVVEQDFHLE
jgi:hypothetical protein